MGGAFGGKESQGNLPAMTAALAAHLTNQPAKTIYDRDDDFMITGKRHDCRIDYRPGLILRGAFLRLNLIRHCAAVCLGIYRLELRHVPCAMLIMPMILHI